MQKIFSSFRFHRSRPPAADPITKSNVPLSEEIGHTLPLSFVIIGGEYQKLLVEGPLSKPYFADRGLNCDGMASGIVEMS